VDQKAELRAKERAFACMHTPVVGRRSDGPRSEKWNRSARLGTGSFRKKRKKSSLECPDLRQRESRDPEKEREGGSPNGHQYLGAASGAEDGDGMETDGAEQRRRLPAT
jgi:hypothetical protein